MKGIDLTDDRKITEVIPDRPILGGTERTWNSVFLAEYFLPPWELPVLAPSQHLVAVNLNIGSSVEFQQNGKWEEYPLCEGSICIIPAGYAWSSRWTSSMNCLHICLDPAFVSRAVYAGGHPDALQLGGYFCLEDPMIFQIAMALKAEQNENQPCDRLYAESLATALSAHLIKHYSVHKKPLEDYSQDLPQPSLKAALDFIMDNLDQPLSLEALAKLTQMSPSHFAHSFKVALGTSPHQFIVQQRLKKAQYLLEKSDLTIREVACQCGFSSQSHLDTTFRKHEGVTPSQYRQQIKDG